MNRIAAIALVLGGWLAAAPAHAQATLPEPTSPATEEEPGIPDVSEGEETAARAEDAIAAEAAPERDPEAMDPAPADPALVGVYRAFGEEAGLVALMEDFMARLVADPRTKRVFENSDQAMVKKHLVEQFCVILGGPCTYTGRDMRTAHKGFDIDRAQFNALVEILQQSMSARRIPFRAQNRLLAKLAPMHRDVEHR